MVMLPQGVAASVCGVIVAGGVGKRFGNPGGKLLVDVCGRPLMSWSVAAFDASELVDRIVVVCPTKTRAAMVAAAIEPYGFTTPITFADSGTERQDSTRSGVDAAPGECEIVTIHDAARPLITPEAIDAAVRALADKPDTVGAVCGQPAIDTLKLVDEQGSFTATPDRSAYWTVQTPQVFRRDALLAAYASAEREGFVGTDDASLVERAGGKVFGVLTSRDNLKVTVPEDLFMVRALMNRRLQNDKEPAHVE